MPFDCFVPVVAQSVHHVAYRVWEPLSLEGQPGAPRMVAEVAIHMSDGSTREMRIDLQPHLTAAQRTWLTTLLTTIRTKAQTEILPSA